MTKSVFYGFKKDLAGNDIKDMYNKYINGPFVMSSSDEIKEAFKTIKKLDLVDGHEQKTERCFLETKADLLELGALNVKSVKFHKHVF